MTHSFVSLAARTEAAGGAAALPVRTVQAALLFGQWTLEIWGSDLADPDRYGNLTSLQAQNLARCLGVTEPQVHLWDDRSGTVTGRTADDIRVTIFVQDEKPGPGDGQ